MLPDFYRSSEPHDTLGGSSWGATNAQSTRGGSSNHTSKISAGGTRGQAGGAAGGNFVYHAECKLGITDLLDNAAKSEQFNWVGGDNTTADDDPCGFQGAFYAYSDKGADEVPGSADDTLQSPAFVSGTEYESPCVGGKCCISGVTSLLPAEDVYTTCGAGLGFSLSDAGEGEGKRAYAGPAKGVKMMLAGSIKNQEIRIGFTQSADDESAPYMTTTLGEVTLMFTDVTCPSWATACQDPSNSPFDVQIQICGGETGREGPFQVCLTSLIPIE